MGYTAEHVASTKARIIKAAGREFRRVGYEAAGIDKIMSEAGLTRGGFYAHFKSKADLFAAVMAEPFDFANQVNELHSAGLRGAGALQKAFGEYLRPERREVIAEACGMASSAVETARMDDEARAGFSGSLVNLIDLLEEDTGDRAEATRKLAQAVGALILARASTPQLAEEILTAARRPL